MSIEVVGFEAIKGASGFLAISCWLGQPDMELKKKLLTQRPSPLLLASSVACPIYALVAPYTLALSPALVPVTGCAPVTLCAVIYFYSSLYLALPPVSTTTISGAGKGRDIGPFPLPPVTTTTISGAGTGRDVGPKNGRDITGTETPSVVALAYPRAAN
ncbi:hypothetical protein NE237_016509 [Protea cynaroides]|uniref:Uncharacterized protein n=1 Tax=Protea cynaroides TaxID=273540 RepID=A0A9Q0HH91_9MAGN|nr:hypothetical protein NE237_016509 [Protea cynaroides]